MEWPTPFHPVENREYKHAFEAELKRELIPDHPLFGIPASCIGRRDDQDDFLFELLDESGRVAEVHLTYGTAEQPPLPATRIFSSIAVWRTSVIHESEKGKQHHDGTQG